MRDLTCPDCDYVCKGGSTMVVHLIDFHEYSSPKANDIVDDLFEREK